MHRNLPLVTALLGACIAALLGVLAYQYQRFQAGPGLVVPFHAVLLTNGQVFYGRLEGADMRFPVLRDVHYLRTQVNPETKQVTNVVVKRGSEWHSPDSMILHAAHVILIEPVKPGSQMAVRLEESLKAAPDPAKR